MCTDRDLTTEFELITTTKLGNRQNQETQSTFTKSPLTILRAACVQDFVQAGITEPLSHANFTYIYSTIAKRNL